MAPMLRPLFARTLAALGLVALLSTPLSAQLDPRLQKDKTDFLDLYQQTNSQTMKPEIVTIFDFTGSMDSIMFHPNFPNTDLTDGDGGANMKFSLTYTGGAYVCTASLYINGSTLTAKSNSATNPLIRPDGSVLTAANIDANYVASSPALPGETASPKSSDVRNWVRSLSHVRFTKNGRTLDIPVPWTILDDSSVTPGTKEYRKQYMGYPLKMTILDPNTGAAPGTEYEMDTRYRIPSNTLVSSSGTVPLSSYTMSGVVYRNAYFNWLFSSASAPYVPDASTTGGVAFKNGIPARTRVSAVKDAAMRTWAKYHGQVYWAYRFIHDITDNVSQENTHGTTVYSDSRTNMPAKDPRTDFVTGGAQRGWYLLNTNSLTGLQRLAAYQSGGNTPMTYAMGNTLAQLNDPNNVFNDIETGADKPVDCMKHFVILFTDGFPNTDAGGENMNTPYLSGNTFDANMGNGVIKGNPSLMNPNSTDWNPMNLAAVAAHLGGGRPDITNFIDPSTASYPAAGTYPSGSGASVSTWLPFYIKSRGTGTNYTPYSKPHPIYTMTVGLSMAGSVTDSSSPKKRLMLAAAFGDPTRVHADDITQLKPFTLLNPSDPYSRDPNSVLFFDATDPQTLVDNMDAAFAEAGNPGGTNATSKPTVPFVGLGLSTQIYLGNFQIPLNGGSMWSGDLQMFPTRQINGQTVILDQSGALANKIDFTSATWTGADALYARGWANRKVFTRLPATTSVPNPPLVPFAYRPTSGSTSAFDAIKAYVGPSTMNDDAKNKLIEFVLGADTTSTTTPYPSRIAHPALKSDTIGIMGDVINSAPAAVEYTLTPTLIGQLPATLASAASNPGARFRVIFVGTNTGMLHAFGEVSWPYTADPINHPSDTYIKGVADELWAFVPTDLLAHLDYLEGLNTHRFMVDGSPYVYHLDLAPTGSMLPNGTVDSNETARVVFGLRKGGRSYYALDIHDPFNPAMAWALSPDEVTANPGILDGRIESSNPALVKTLVQNMGFSSANLAVGRVAYGSPTVHLRDALFLGGGFSTPDIDTAFASKLGRSVLAVDAANGNILQAWDFLNDNALKGTALGMGPVGSGVVPFEYFLNSGLVQRAYFTDFNGSLWALGSGKTSFNTSDGHSYRNDTSSLDAWTQDGGVGSNLALRKVYAGTANDFVTTLPAPFLTGNVPTTAGAIPVGIAMASGNRDNPLDYNPPASLTQHEVSVFFDNQEATLGQTPITPSDLYVVLKSAPGVTPPEVTPGNASFYLANGKRGYVIPFPAKANGYISKGINEPMVLGGAMFFSYFTPEQSDPCTGGSGVTSTNRVCDVLFPAYQGNTTTVDNSYNGPCVSGHLFAWSGVATNFSARSTVSVNQAGMVSTGGTGAPGNSQVFIKTIFGQVRDRLPRPRTWRTVR